MWKYLFLLVVSAAAECHPMANRRYLINNAGIGWVSFNNDGHWLYGKYDRKEDAAPFLFEAVPGKCNTYKLQNKWYDDNQWVSFTTQGKWIRAIYSNSDAMPIEFHDVGNGLWKMKNVWPGEGHWISYTSSSYAMRAVYNWNDAMGVWLFETEKSKQLNAIHVVSTKYCVSMVQYSLGWVRGEVSVTKPVKEGASETKSYSQSFKAGIKSDAHLSAKVEGFGGGASTKYSIEAAVAAAQREVTSSERTVDITTTLDGAKEGYVYVGYLEYRMSDGGVIKAHSSKQIKTTTRLQNMCVGVSVPSVIDFVERENEVNSLQDTSNVWVAWAMCGAVVSMFGLGLLRRRWSSSTAIESPYVDLKSGLTA